MSVYYNENDPFAAAWLRELMQDGLIAPGWVDERSIEDVLPLELQGFTQCHFFAGIGVWSLALRVAGWPDDRPIWTGSCPCQPFSAAGKGAGFADERHLWPAWYHLIEHGKRRDVVVVGEQVASKDGRTWFDLVSGDMQALDHACGAVDTSAASLGAPFIGQRLYWVGATSSVGSGCGCELGTAPRSDQVGTEQRERLRSEPVDGSDDHRLATSESGGYEGDALRTGRIGSNRDATDCHLSRLATPDSSGSREIRRDNGEVCGISQTQRKSEHGAAVSGRGGCISGSSHRNTEHSDGIPLHPTRYWDAADWLLCRDPNGARFRPVEPGTFPLAHGGSVVNRLAAVRGAGNALNISQAACFIEAVMELLDS